MEDRRVDLNTASVEELMELPGIGRALATRIVQYRETVHPFREPVEITAVPGIGERMYQTIADRLTVTPVEPPPPSAVEGLLSEEVAEELPSEEVAEVEEEERPAYPKRAAPPPKPIPSPVRERPAPPPASRTRVGLSWLWSALLGGVLGMLFTLLVLAGINGSLAINRTEAVLEMRSQVEDLAAAVDTLQSEAAGLRQRLDGLEGLTARMERAESAVGDLREETAALAQQVGALENDVGALSEDLAAVQSHAERVEAFFQRLQALLAELFGEETPVAPEPAPPSPGQ